MSPKTYISTVFDDTSRIVADLLDDAMQNAGSEALGLLFCDSRIDCEAVLRDVQAKLPFPVTGGTTMTFPFVHPSGEDISAGLTVLRKEGMKAAIVLSEPLDAGRHREQMDAVYEACRARLGEDPKMLLPLFPLMPSLPTGFFIEDLFALAGDVPVFGGVTTNDLISTRAGVFAEGRTASDRMVLVVLGGPVCPVFSTANLVSPMVEYAPLVTRAEGNEVYRVDESSFCDYMRTVGISPEDRVNGVDALMQYGPTPVLVQTPGGKDNDVPDVRCISFTNMEQGSAFFSGPVPEGARLRMSILRKQDVESSVRDCLAKLDARMDPARKEGYEYSALLCVTCVARYFAFVGGANVEGEILSRETPRGLAATGLYAFAEIGPAYGPDGKGHNRSHSASIAMCAI